MVGQVLDACEEEIRDPCTCHFSVICKCNFAVLCKYVLATAIDYVCSTTGAMNYTEKKLAYRPPLYWYTSSSSMEGTFFLGPVMTLPSISNSTFSKPH
jgi:hypothetical protein